MTADFHAGYYGAEVNDQSLTPSDNPRLGPNSLRRMAQARPRPEPDLFKTKTVVKPSSNPVAFLPT